MTSFFESSKSLDPHGTHNNLAYNPATQRYYGFGRVSNAPFRIESVAVSKTSDFHGEWMPAVKCGLEKDEDLEYQPDALVVRINSSTWVCACARRH